jgi:hypothetical protein
VGDHIECPECFHALERHKRSTGCGVCGTCSKRYSLLQIVDHRTSHRLPPTFDPDDPEFDPDE